MVLETAGLGRRQTAHQAEFRRHTRAKPAEVKTQKGASAIWRPFL